jgi:lipopolysaccharide/colanic/teichoic acid biosynthesis glycosyltransferase
MSGATDAPRAVAVVEDGEPTIVSPSEYPLKRAFDIAAASGIVILMLPVGLLIAVLLLVGGGPVFYVAPRRGKNARIFAMYKFRTMLPGAEAMLTTCLDRDPRAMDCYRRSYKIEADPRVTRLGRFLRRYSFDELPQLLNVIRGEMSLVGPRPRGEAEFAEAGADHDDPLLEAYYGCRPGMTGLWQVSGRSDIDYAVRLRLDAEYARSMSLGRDLAILARTVPVVLVGRGAY